MTKTITTKYKDGTYSIKCYNTGIIKWYNSEDKLHRANKPAIIHPNGSEYWYSNGNLHREDGPAFIDVNKVTTWYYNGFEHRIDSLSSAYKNGTYKYYRRNKLHRINGPAALIKYSGSCNFAMMWCQNGLRHRIDGPAIKYINDIPKYTDIWLLYDKVVLTNNPSIIL